MNALPKRRKKCKVLIICEGFEEYEYVESILKLGIVDNQIDVDLLNAESITKIGAKLDFAYRQGKYDFVCVFCDTDHRPFESFEDVIKSVNSFIEGMADFVVFYGNPVTMQIVLLHFGDVKLTSNQKKDNRIIIKKYTGVSNYDAKANQRKKIFSQITCNNYADMKKRIAKLSNKYEDTSSSNFHELLECLEDYSVLKVRLMNIEKLNDD